MTSSGSRSGSFAQTKPPAFKDKLLMGEKFLKWTDQDSTGIPVTLKVDPNGFFLYFYDQKDEVTLIDFFQIRDIRTGDQARTPKDQKVRSIVNMGSDKLEDKTITIVFGTDFVNTNFINFCTHKVEYAQLWSRELWDYTRSCNPLNMSSIQNIQKIHTQLMLITHKQDSPIPVKNIIKFFASKDKEDKKLVEKALDTSGFCSGKTDFIDKKDFGFDQFQVFYQKLLTRQDISNVFSKFCSEPNSKVMTCKEFLKFLNDYQRDPRLNEILYPYAQEEKAVNLIKKYEPNDHLISKNQLSCEGFTWFLLSEDNLVMSPERLLKMDDMEKPLSNYFIASSHNTYLTGHQLTGKAGVEMYRQVLLSGCRCIELDFWDGEEEPHITHGYTIVNKLPAKQVIEAIAECAFKTSDYPLVLSFENHCKFKQQAKIAQYCKQYFGDMMLDYPLKDHPLNPKVQLPSPESLKGKILIKNKKQHIHHHPKAQPSSNPVTPSKKVEPVQSDQPDDGAISDSDSDSDSDSEEDESIGSNDLPDGKIPDKVISDEGTAGKESKACAEISALVNYVTPVRFKSFEHANNRKRAFEMSSFDEKIANQLLKGDPIAFVKYNKFQTSRIYPKGTRVDSSNYMPQIFWNAGCQFVALNYQNLDVPMQLNLGIFQYNRRTGFLLKPDFMCRDDRKFDPFTETSVDGIVPHTVSLKIISGQFLTDKRVGSYIEVEMYGLPRDTVRRKFRTKTIQNGINPIFDEEPFVFRQVVMPDLAVFRIAAFEEGNKLIGHRVLPIVGLCPGYRHIPLFNEVGQPMSLPSLFVLITVGDYVPNAWTDLADALTNPIKHQSEIERRNKMLEVLTDELETSETDTKQGQDEPQSPLAMAGTPEAASPTVENLKRIGSNTKKLGCSKDGSPVNGPQRTDSNKSLPIKLDDCSASNTLKSKPFVAASVEEILEHKSVKEKYSELELKLKELRKKKDKELIKIQASVEKLTRTPSKPNKNPLNRIGAGIKKKFSTANLDSSASQTNSEDSEAKCETLKRSHVEKEFNCEKNYIILEKELKEKYFDSIYNCSEKVMLKSQSSQMNSLKNLHDHEASEVMKRIELDFKEDNEKGSMASISKEDMQRERRAWLVNRGVIEKRKLQELYNEKKQELETGQTAVRDELKEKFSNDKKDLNEACKKSLLELEAKLQGSDCINEDL